MANFEQATGRTITESFELFHRLNPGVYEEVKRLAFDALNKGRKKISFKLIINVIRWEKFIQTEEPTLWNLDGKPTAFKINDAYSSRYARLFVEEFPNYAEFIEFRELRSEKESMPLQCRKCQKPTRWLYHKETKKPAPIEAEPNENGNILVHGTEYRIANKEEIEKAKSIGHPLYLNHFASCPFAASFSKKGEKTKA